MAGPRHLRYGESPSQYILFTPATSPATPSPLIVLLHGGFWRGRFSLRPPTAATYHTLAPFLHARCYAVAELEYRRDADTPWGFPHTNDDVVAAYTLAVSQPGIDRARVVIVGHSAGGTLALWLAAQSARGVAPSPLRTYALAPVADLVYAARLRLSDSGDAIQRFVGGEPEEVPEKYEKACPMFWAAELGSGVTLAVGRQDSDVPMHIVERLSNKVMQVVGKADSDLCYWVLDETDHFQIVDAGSPAWQAIADDIDTRLSQSESVPT